MNIFSPLSKSFQDELTNLPESLRKTLPLKAAHWKNLPFDIADLSSLLTDNRTELTRPYWIQAKFMSAYFWYFLPWNLIRLASLLPNLPLNIEREHTILDIGTGPLTLPLALWLTRSDLRTMPINIICTDAHLAPMQAGLRLLTEIAGPDLPWNIELVKADVKEALAIAKRKSVNLITALNVFNELKDQRRRPMQLLLKDIAREIGTALAPDASLLLLEPGNRLGGKIISTLRDYCIELGLYPSLPCPHKGPCPMLQKEQRTWCHFVQDVVFAPKWLLEISDAAALSKTQTALSFVLLNGKGKNKAEHCKMGKTANLPASTKKSEMPGSPGTPGNILGRIISNSFKVPGYPRCRYACTEKGIVLVPGADRCTSGTLVTLRAAIDKKDDKSGVPVCYLEGESAQMWALPKKEAPLPEAPSTRRTGSARVEKLQDSTKPNFQKAQYPKNRNNGPKPLAPRQGEGPKTAPYTPQSTQKTNHKISQDKNQKYIKR